MIFKFQVTALVSDFSKKEVKEWSGMEWGAVEENRIKQADTTCIKYWFLKFPETILAINMYPELQCKNNILLWLKIQKSDIHCF